MCNLMFPTFALAAMGCAAQPAPIQTAGQEYTYACAGAKTFHVSFDADFTYAVVNAGKATFKVPAVMAASGTRYSDEKVEFWEHHGEAMLNGVPGETFADCKQTDLPPA
jgi:membrane-bound inhibitor of C-type lysozyme